jgi:orotate phosphoribosyltransferase
MVECGVLLFGMFTLKSGRESPYFLNTGNYKECTQLIKLGEFYADCIVENSLKFDTLMGPSYKGIPLVVSTGISLYTKHGIATDYCFDRKTEKKHGEGGCFVGNQLSDGEHIVIVEDVITSGMSLREEIIPKLKSTSNVSIEALIISVDRMEKSFNSKMTAREQIEVDYGIKTCSLVDIFDIINAIENNVIDGKNISLKYINTLRSTGRNKNIIILIY